MRVARVAAVAALLTAALCAARGVRDARVHGRLQGRPAASCAAAGSSPRRSSPRVRPVHAGPAGFIEYQHGIEYLAQKYPRWVSVFKLRDLYGDDAVSAGADGKRSYEDGRHRRRPRHLGHEDHRPQGPGQGQGDAALLALGPRQRARRPRGRPAHGRGPRDRRRRTAARSSTASTTTSRRPARSREFHEYEVSDVLPRRPSTSSTSTSTAGRSATCGTSRSPSTYKRGNALGTDLNRQMPTIGPHQPEPQPAPGERDELRHEVHARGGAGQGQGGQMAYGADIHGESNSQAYIDIMYPAGEFDSVDHRRLMAIAERTKSVIDETLYEGIVDENENADRRQRRRVPRSAIPTKPAHWATVWDTLGYTDTGFIGDYLATELGVTGMDYEISSTTRSRRRRGTSTSRRTTSTPRAGSSRPRWPTRCSRSGSSATRTSRSTPVGRAGYVVNPDTVTDTDENGPGTLPGPEERRHRRRTASRSSSARTASRTRSGSRDTNKLMPQAVRRASRPATSRRSPRRSNAVDTLVLADIRRRADPQGRPVDSGDVLREHRGLGRSAAATSCSPTARCTRSASSAWSSTEAVDGHPGLPAVRELRGLRPPDGKGLRPNARQLVEAAILGYGIGDDASPMTVVDTAAWEDAGGHVIGTTDDAAHRRGPGDRPRPRRRVADVGRRAAARQGPDPDRRRRAADADRGERPPLRPAQLRADVLGPVPHGERHPARREGALSPTSSKRKAKRRPGRLRGA